MNKKNFYALLTVLLLAITILFFYGITTSDKKINKKNDNVNRLRELYMDMAKNGIVIIYPTNLPIATIDKYKDQLENFRLFFRGMKMELIADSSVTDSILMSKNIVVVGTINSNRILNKVKSYLPIKFTNDGFEFNNIKFNNSYDEAFIAYKNPFNDKKISFFIVGNSDDYVMNNINLRYLSGIQIRSNYENYIIGEYNIDSNNNWILTHDKYWEFGKDRRSYEFYNGNIISHSGDIPKLQLSKLMDKIKSKIDELKNFFGKDFKVYNFDYHLFDEFETKGLIIQNTELTNYDIKNNAVSTVTNSWIDDEDFSSLSGYLIEKNYGSSIYDFLKNGFSTYFSQNWRSKSYKYWASKIYLSKIFPTLSELLNNKQYQYISDYITHPLGGVFIDYYVNRYGKGKAKDFYWQNKKLNSNEIKKLEADWKIYLDKMSKNYSEEIKNEKDNFPSLITSFQKGLSYAHEGYQIHNGYLSQSSFLSLKKAVELGTNSISIIPYTSIRDPKKPSPFRFWRNAFSENDETIIYLEHLSHLLNLNLMLKPQIYLGRGWPGDIEMTSEKDWNEFFYNYKNWIVHYAMIAEMYKIPILCIGNEMVKTTINRNDDWLKLIEEIRSIYSGKITYGANWGEEFENIKFWDKLDFIGVSEYYPLSQKNNPTDEELYLGAENIIKKISVIHKKYNKPVIFTEVGFRSSEKPWLTANEKETRTVENEQNQARCYQAILRASENVDWLKGMYWWKWPSYLQEGGDPQNDLYTPHNKFAESVLRNWYNNKLCSN